ncbi:MAG: 50S ribosomal protein L17 [Deltaproteobacteria bacterium]|nr:50S ribosomal protein L17 [Deltaproteobacteria bacterium]
MRHHVAYRKLGRTTAHRIALLRNLATQLVMRDRIETTVPKAKELRRYADRLVTLGKAGTVAARRRAATLVADETVLTKVFSQFPDRFQGRNGGYTRILRLGHRHGDSAPMAIIEYVTADVTGTVGKKEKRSGSGRGKKKGLHRGEKGAAPAEAKKDSRAGVATRSTRGPKKAPARQKKG